MDAFRELSPQEIKLATLQFMGQHLTGEIKELNNNLVSQSATLRNLNINPGQVLNTIPGDQNQNTYSTTVNAGINVNTNNPIPALESPQVNPLPLSPKEITANDPNQLEFDFNNSNYAKLIFERLDDIDRKISNILNKN